MSCRLCKFVCIDYFSHACGKIPERGEHKGGSQFYGVAIVVGKARERYKEKLVFHNSQTVDCGKLF